MATARTNKATSQHTRKTTSTKTSGNVAVKQNSLQTKYSSYVQSDKKLGSFLGTVGGSTAAQQRKATKTMREATR